MVLLKGISILSIGYGNFINAGEVICVVSPNSVPIKRLISDARDQQQLIDASNGKRTRAAVLLDTGEIILSALRPETIGQRFTKPISSTLTDVEEEEEDENEENEEIMA